MRELGTFETALTLTGRRASFVVVVVLELDGGPPPERLRPALDALQRRHPLLAVRIVEKGGRFRFVGDGVPEIPLVSLERRGEGHWTEVAEAELDRPLPEGTGPLLRCTYLAPAGEGGGSEIVLAFHHAVVDGVSAEALAGELLRLLYSEGAAEGPPGASEPAVDPPLPPVEALFPPGFRGFRGLLRQAAFAARQAADEAAYRWRRRPGRGAHPRPPEEPGRCRVLPVRLPAEATAALVRRSRRERATLHGALAAALLLAVQEQLHGGRPGPFRHVAFADLRPRLRPPVPPERLGCCISMLRLTVDLPPGGGGRQWPGRPVWELARRIDAGLTAGLRRGDRFTAALLAPRMMRTVLGQPRHRMNHRMGATALSYSGPVRLGSREEGGAASGAAPSVRGVHGFVSSLAVAPEYTAQARLFDGELLLDVVYLDADMDRALAERIAGRALETLRTAGAGEEGS